MSLASLPACKHLETGVYQTPRKKLLEGQMALGNEHHFKQPLGLFDGSHGPMATCCRTPPNWPVAAELDGTVYLFQVIYPNTNDQLVRKLIRCGYPIISISGCLYKNISLQQLSRRQRWMGTTPDRCPCLVPGGENGPGSTGFDSAKHGLNHVSLPHHPAGPARLKNLLQSHMFGTCFCNP